MNNQPKILLVNNDKTDYKSLLSFLQDNGYDILRTNGYSLDELVNLSNPDLVIMDNLTDNNALYQRIKQKEIPILCIIDSESPRNLSSEFNNVSYIVKPFFYKDLTEHINMLLKLSSLKDENNIYKMEYYKLRKAGNVANLSGIIAHDINNYLGAVIGYSDILKSVINGNERIQQYLDKIIESAQNIATLTQRQLEFSRSLRSEPKNENLKEIIDRAVFLCKNLKDFHLDVEITEDLTEINVDKDQIQFAITNLLLYFGKISNNSKIAVRAFVAQLPEICAFNPIHDKYLNLSISCLGVDLDQKVIEQLNNPIKIEKAIIESDLIVVKNIIEKNMGFINANNDPSKGITFNVYLPTI